MSRHFSSTRFRHLNPALDGSSRTKRDAEHWCPVGALPWTWLCSIAWACIQPSTWKQKLIDVAWPAVPCRHSKMEKLSISTHSQPEPLFQGIIRFVLIVIFYRTQLYELLINRETSLPDAAPFRAEGACTPSCKQHTLVHSWLGLVLVQHCPE